MTHEDFARMRVGFGEFKALTEQSEVGGMRMMGLAVPTARHVVDYVAHLEQLQTAGAAKGGAHNEETSPEALPVAQQDERAMFEAWMKSRVGYPFAGAFANLMWDAWQARAALSSKRQDAQGQEIGNPGLEDFTAYMIKHYPSGSVIHDPAWHAPRLYGAVMCAATFAAPSVPTGGSIDGLEGLPGLMWQWNQVPSGEPAKVVYGQIRGLIAAHVASKVQAAPDALRRAVREMTASLEEREWAEHVSTDPDAAALEAAITELVGLHEKAMSEVQATRDEASQNAARWDFMMHVADNEDGPEEKAMEAAGHGGTFDSARPKSVQLEEMVDEAMAAMRSPAATEDKGDQQ